MNLEKRLEVPLTAGDFGWVYEDFLRDLKIFESFEVFF